MKKKVRKRIKQPRLVVREARSNHDHWTNGNEKTTVPRHPDVNEMTAKSIIKKASQNPGKNNVD